MLRDILYKREVSFNPDFNRKNANCASIESGFRRILTITALAQFRSPKANLAVPQALFISAKPYFTAPKVHLPGNDTVLWYNL
jgi:hypothetical protein